MTQSPAYLYAIHDPGGEHLMADAPGTIVYTFNVTDPPLDFSGLAAQGFRAIARINHSHHGNGTIPPDPNDWPAFAQACAAFVQGCRGVRDFTIGNEINIAAEWGRDEPVTPEQYAECYRLVYDAVKDRVPEAQLAPAAIGPWNVESGVEWVEYFRRVLINVERIDWINLHAYSRGYGPRDVTDNSWMDAPHQNRRSGFRAYKDFLNAVPAVLRSLPVDITESNGNGTWPDENTGWVQAVYGEVVRHNAHPGTQKIRSLALFRWKHFEGQPWGFEHKANVHEDFRRAVAKRYEAPAVEIAGPDPDEPDIFLPTVGTGGKPMPDLPAREIGGDFRARVPEIKLSDGAGDKPHYRLIRAEYVPDAASRFGPDHHILVDVLDADGARVLGVPVNVWWGTGAAIKTTDKPAGPYALDYAMFNAGHSFGVKVADDDATSDSVFGLGLGKIGSEHIADHVGYYLVFREANPQVRPVVPRPQPGKVPKLTHPVANPAHRRVTQVFGVNPKRYARFGLDGHNGVDFAVPVGQPIRAAARGTVVEARNDDGGYGKYIKLRHPWGETLYAHLSVLLVAVGMAVDAGAVIAQSGNTGNSTGAHLHFGLRVNPYTRGRPFDGYSDPLPYLAGEGESPVEPQPPADIVATVREAAREFGVDEELMLSLAWAESSWNPNAVSGAGAKGLFQVMPNTWDEQAPRVGASDPFNARDNARVASVYYKWLSAQVANERRALWAYNFGIGHILAGRTPPAETIEFANKVIHGRDLLRAVMQ